MLRVEDVMVSETIEKSFKEHGVEIIAGIAEIDRIEKLKSGLEAFLWPSKRAGAGRQTDAIILSTGWLGNLDSRKS